MITRTYECRNMLCRRRWTAVTVQLHEVEPGTGLFASPVLICGDCTSQVALIGQATAPDRRVADEMGQPR